MYKTKKKANSKGSVYNAYKLSYTPLEGKVEHQDNISQILIGCDDDDEFYNNDDEGRLKVYVGIDNPNVMTSFDLEDFIKQVKIKCPHLF